MSSAETSSRILDAAEIIFAKKGYESASIRRITSLAGVDLGSVRYHFGSKDRLFGAVMERRLRPLCEERARRLDALEAEWGDEPVPVERLIESFVRPAVDLICDREHGRCWMNLIGRVRVEPGSYLDSVQVMYAEILKRYLALFARAIPDLCEEEQAYRFYFLFGVEVNTLVDDGTLRALRPGLPVVYEDPDAVVAHLVRFASAGMRAPAAGEMVTPIEADGAVATQRTGLKRSWVG